MNINDYHSDPAIGSSGIRSFISSPARYFADYLDPARERREATPAMAFGSAFHCAALEPDLYAKTYAAAPEGLDRRTKEGKEFYARAESVGITILKMQDAAAIERMVSVLHSHPLWPKHGEAERSIFHADTESGLKLKIRPDYSIRPCEEFPFGEIHDLKTTIDASPQGFGKSAWGYGYLLQAAFYCDVWQAFYRTDQPPRFVLWAQEKTAPYLVKPYVVTDEMLAYGRSLYVPVLPQIAACLQSGVWPGYGDDIEPILLPAWAQREIDGDDVIVDMEIVENE